MTFLYILLGWMAIGVLFAIKDERAELRLERKWRKTGGQKERLGQWLGSAIVHLALSAFIWPFMQGMHFLVRRIFREQHH